MTAALVSFSFADNSAVVYLNGARYEYFFPSAEHLRTLDFLFRRWGGRAVNYAKRHATHWRKL